MLDDLRKHDAKLKLAEKNALKRLIRLLQKSRTEVIGSLMDTPSEWTETTLLSTLRNIDLLMLELKGQLGIEFDTIVKDGAKKGFKDENDLFEKFFSDKLKDVSNSLLFGVVELTVLKTFLLDLLLEFVNVLRILFSKVLLMDGVKVILFKC